MMIRFDADKLDDAEFCLSAVRALSDLLCELPDMHPVNPDNLGCLITIVADRLERALSR